MHGRSQGGVIAPDVLVHRQLGAAQTRRSGPRKGEEGTNACREGEWDPGVFLLRAVYRKTLFSHLALTEVRHPV
ncbi:unnamed protein product [Rangifer tarandus platyrhynchus]|uniref:Uncharacterized protein n=1 Tax=Rangifer tarandus platyrhynchus TaxID=3082113 RepID=A0ABN9A837_RANTA|nr:unnamed protein product [Rangifer tarandus platyrhynchus]